MNIYQRLSALHKTIISNPEIIQLIELLWVETMDKNPSVRNKRFRQLFESHRMEYHKQGYSPKEIYYRVTQDYWEVPACEICGNEITADANPKIGFARHCSTKCSATNPKTKRQRVVTTQEKYGVDNVFQASSVKDDIKQMNVEKYGVERYQQTQVFKDKFKSTVASHTDERKAEIHQKKIVTWLKNYGVDHCQKSLVIQQKTRSTCQEKFGVNNPFQRPEHHAHIYNNSRKQFTFPSGNTHTVQGYEDKAITRLLIQGYSEHQISLVNKPFIKYIWSSNDGFGDDQQHIYFPDIFIPHENRLIEVKSQWTYDGNGKRPDRLSKNLAKKEGALLAGYAFDFWILT